MNKRFLLFLASFAFILLFTTTANATTFKDVPTGHSNYENIDYLIELKVIKGYPDGSFRPNNSVTNRQAAIMLVRALGLTDGATSNPGYNDVPQQDSAYKEIAIAAKAGLFPTGGNFSPNSYITRESMARSLTNAFELTGNSKANFSDVSKSYWAYSYIDSLATHTITTGFSDGSFRPKDSVTRSHFSAFLVRAMDPSKRPTTVNTSIDAWKGSWERPILHSEGVLNIKNIRNNTFEFLIGVANGSSGGSIEGKATVTGNKAVFTSNEYDSFCKLEMTLNDKVIDIKQSSGCHVHGGIGTFFEGEYLHPSLASNIPENTLSSLGIVTPQLDKDIRKLVGNDYSTIVESMQFVNYVEEDGFEDIMIIEGSVRGLYSFLQSTIGLDSFGNLYVATIIDGEKIRFYTNDPAHKRFVPFFVSYWSEDFSDYPVEYIYKDM